MSATISDTWRRNRKPPKTISCGARTDVGCVREHNEDAALVAMPLFAVADGMGGHAAGEVASEIAISTLDKQAPRTANREALRCAMQNANQAIINAVLNGIGRPGMGTTMTALVVDGDRALIAQVGDSRAYLLRNNVLRQITADHSLVAELVAVGEITPEEAAIHPNRSVITRALGSEEDTQIDIFCIELLCKDRLLLCSDGLSGMVSDARIAELLNSQYDAQQTTDALILEARSMGGLDNITAIVVDIHQTPPAKDGAIAGVTGITATGTVAAEKQAATLRASLGKGTDRRRSWHLGIITFVLLAILLVGGAFGGVYLYAKSVAFVTIEGDTLAVYSGLADDIVGIKLRWKQTHTDLTIDDLTITAKNNILKDGYITFSSYEEAKKWVSKQEDGRLTYSATNSESNLS
ncbi:MAG: Stp1/IreP family PP2C-type Ser/Thr phosphatase [Coriobacteriales bacterium]|jgi:protein phosphatase|nr:Stp1/IreP family PP2C-type Ser/Thr phosphatase [Coriobacteriales bacterium]